MARKRSVMPRELRENQSAQNPNVRGAYQVTPQNPAPEGISGQSRVTNISQADESWVIPEESWMKMEIAEDREIFFVNVVLEDAEECPEMATSAAGGGQVCVVSLGPEEEYETWLERQKDKRRLRD
jgi:hypothetical protein